MTSDTMRARMSTAPDRAITLAHEMGHTFGLWHTHHGSVEHRCTVCDESNTQPKALRDTVGDLCSDTLVDTPYWLAEWVASAECRQSDNFSVEITRPSLGDNLMSYLASQHGGHMTPQQASRVRCWALNQPKPLVTDNGRALARVPLSLHSDRCSSGLGNGATRQMVSMQVAACPAPRGGRQWTNSIGCLRCTRYRLRWRSSSAADAEELQAHADLIFELVPGGSEAGRPVFTGEFVSLTRLGVTQSVKLAYVPADQRWVASVNGQPLLWIASNASEPPVAVGVQGGVGVGVGGDVGVGNGSGGDITATSSWTPEPGGWRELGGAQAQAAVLLGSAESSMWGLSLIHI